MDWEKVIEELLNAGEEAKQRARKASGVINGPALATSAVIFNRLAHALKAGLPENKKED